MKYIVFKFNNLYMPIVFPEHITHSQIKLEGATAISAGFYKVNYLGIVKAYGKSESLNLESNYERDSNLIFKVLNGFSTMFFLEENLKEV